MQILIVTPTRGTVQTGNRCTASAWAEVLRGLGHEVQVTNGYRGESAEVLVALHARRSHEALARYQAAWPAGKSVVVLTGTDVYPAPDSTTLDSLARADRIVGLQAEVVRHVPEECRDKLRVIVQSARRPPEGASPERRSRDPFVVSVVGHLRAVKDPLRTALAVRNLPETSRIEVRHAGAILDLYFAKAVPTEEKKNPRYRWLGELDHAGVESLLLESQVMVLSSFSEGGARVLGEALQCGTPVLAARNEATVALLGQDYPGLFPAGETAELAELLTRAESDADFLNDLRARTAQLAEQFEPAREREAWRALLAELNPENQSRENQ